MPRLPRHDDRHDLVHPVANSVGRARRRDLVFDAPRTPILNPSPGRLFTVLQRSGRLLGRICMLEEGAATDGGWAGGVEALATPLSRA